MKKKHEPYDKIFKRIMFAELFDKIGEGLSVLVNLDIIVHENKSFVKMWTIYNKMLIKVRKTPEKYGQTKKSVRDLEKFCAKLTTQILNGQLFITFLKDLNEIINKELGANPPSKNSYFEEKYNDYLNYKIETITQDASDPSTKATLDKPLLWLLTNYALMRSLFPKKEDSKLFKKIWGLMKFCPMISVYGLHSLNIGMFLNAIVPLKKPIIVTGKQIGRAHV